ncbi:unnamed protein product [Symbiodinium sp. CCMP2592]|nr:unnamed protein product [Symbiodinium sp. CCMP2592]
MYVASYAGEQRAAPFHRDREYFSAEGVSSLARRSLFQLAAGAVPFTEVASSSAGATAKETPARFTHEGTSFEDMLMRVAAAERQKERMPRHFGQYPNPEWLPPHLEACHRPRGMFVARLRPGKAGCGADIATDGAFAMHSQHPLLQTLGFAQNTTQHLVYWAERKIVFWGASAAEAWSICRDTMFFSRNGMLPASRHGPGPNRWNRRAWPSYAQHRKLKLKGLCAGKVSFAIMLWQARYKQGSHVPAAPDSKDHDYVGGSAPSDSLAQCISHRIVVGRIQDVQRVVRANIREFVTSPALWLRVPNPFDVGIDARTWKHYMDCVEFESGKITPDDDIDAQRHRDLKRPDQHSLSDLERAIKRLDAWTRVMLRLIEHGEMVDITLILSPVDPLISKRAWERHLWSVRCRLAVLSGPVVPTPQQEPPPHDYSGGKTVDAAAADLTSFVRDLHFDDTTHDTAFMFDVELDDDAFLHQPLPLRPLPPDPDSQDGFIRRPRAILEEPEQVQQITLAGDDSDSEEGVWYPSFDLSDGGYNDVVLNAVQPQDGQKPSTDYEGGGLLDELLVDLPGFYFSFDYLRKLACTCTKMLRAVQDRRHWRGRRVSVNTEEFQDPTKLRWMMESYLCAHLVTVNIRQLAMFHVFPRNVMLEWTARGVVGGPGPAACRHMAGFESSGPLMGAAVFDVVLPCKVVGMYIGVRDWCDLNRRRQAYCRLDNVFLDNAMASFGLADLPPQPHVSRRPVRLQPNRVHRFSVRWHARLFEIMLDGVHIATARAREGAPPAPRALSRLFVWAFARPTPDLVSMVQFRPIRSPVEMTATITCVICNRDFGLGMPRWCVCPRCDTWVCAAHAGQQPERLCSRCPNLLLDYVGGSCRDEKPYPNAGGSTTSTAMTPEQWLRLTLHRQEALRRRRGSSKGYVQLESEFNRIWQASMSPLCCPTYGRGTSQIRLPLPARTPLTLPVLEDCPTNFLEFTIPSVDCDLLRLAHKHPRDDSIRFVEETHTYYLRECRIPLSVTGLVHNFAAEFDADKAIQCMMQSRRWPRPEYSVEHGGLLIPMSPPQIKDLWKANATEAAARGTWLHLQLEVLLNGGKVHENKVELQLFSTFLQQMPKLIAFRSEWCVYGEEEKLAGCIDFVAQTPSSDVILFDWKRTKQLRRKYVSLWSTMKQPLSHLDDCAGIHYRLQLNLYKYLIEKYYGLRVAAMYVVCLHPDNQEEGPFIDCVPDMPSEVDAILEVRRLKLAGQSCDYIGGSSGSGQLPQADAADGDSSQLDSAMPNIGEDPENDHRPSEEMDEQLDRASLSALTQDLQAAIDAVEWDESSRTVLSKARKRSALPGAASTMSRFESTFNSQLQRARESLETAIPSNRNEENNILQQTATIRRNVIAQAGEVPEDLLRVIVAATVVYRMRLSDMHVREQVLLLWVIEGEVHMRCHGGDLYFYRGGAFTLHRGIPPQETLARCKRYMLYLEGLFRLLPGPSPKTDAEVLSAVMNLYVEHNRNSREFLSACEDAARVAVVSRSRSSRRLGEEDAAPEVHDCSLADAISKVGLTMQRHLLDDKIFSLVVEWCDTPLTRASGCSYQDCTVLYDCSQDSYVNFVSDSPKNNIYTHIPHPLRDPVLEEALQRTLAFYSETFWLNNDAAWSYGAESMGLFSFLRVTRPPAIRHPRSFAATRRPLRSPNEART